MNSELLRWFKLRWRGLFQRRSHEAALDREMQFHLDMLVQQNVADGMSPAEARFAALREFGGTEQYREACRDTWQPAFLAGLAGDFRFALRSLKRSPGFAAVAVITLALGIGVNTTIFSFIRDAVIAPHLRDDALNLVSLYNSRADADRSFRHFTHAEFTTLRDSPEVFADVAAEGFHTSAVGLLDHVKRRLVSVVSENYFSVLGVQPFRGRFFTAAESQLGASAPVLVANFAFWERLGRPADFIGSTVRVNLRDYTVVGIAPQGFVGLSVSIGPEVWLPLGEANALAGWDLRKHDQTKLALIGQLQPNLSLEAARSRLDLIDRRLNALPSIGDAPPRQLVITTPPRTALGNTSPQDEGYMTLFAVAAMGLSITVLIVACLNLANMFLARGAARQKEIAIRLSLGASRWRIVRQFLAEGLLLALLGGALALILGIALDHVIIGMSVESAASGNFALSVHSFIDGSLIAATLGFALIATFASSLGPALRVTRLNLVEDLKRQTGVATPDSVGSWSRFFSLANILVTLQIALSLTLLFSAALFLRGSWNARSLDLGFQTDEQLVAHLDYHFAKLPADEVARRQQALLIEASRFPGVTNAALGSNIPYNFELPFHPTRVADGAEALPANDDTRPQHWAGHTAVTRGYFSTMGIRLLRGRDFTAAESAGTSGRAVAVVDESLARALFGEADAVGRFLITGAPSARAEYANQPLEIIGVVRSPRDEVFGKSAPRRLYRPLGQVHATNTYLHLSTKEPLALVDMVRRRLQTFEPAAPILFVRPMAEFIEKNINVLLVRLAALIFGVFGGIALVLAVVGVYGVKAHTVVKRTREIGIRLALGARPGDVMALILKQGLLQTALGLALGVTLALLVGQALSGMLYRVNGTDVPALLVSAAVLSAAVFLACWLPARRATKVDPIISIRAE